MNKISLPLSQTMSNPQSKQVGFSNCESKELPEYLRSSRSPTFKGTRLAAKPQKKYNPEQNVGVSYESPTYFRTKHTLINQGSYKNPFLTNPEDYDSPFDVVHQESPSKSPNKNANKLSHTQTFKIGEDVSKIERNIFEKTRLPALTTYK